VNVTLDLPEEILAALEARVVERLRHVQVEPEPWPEYLSDRTAARYADVATSTVARWRKAGLRYCIRGGVVRIRRRDLDEWLENRVSRSP